MKSLVFWYESNNQLGLPDAELQLHFNHWKLKANNRKAKDFTEYLLDVGIRIKNGSAVDKICFFLPEEISNCGLVIEDLGDKLKDVNILTAVFNENYSSDTSSKEKYFVAKENGQPVLNIYSLDIKSDLISEIKYGGTIIKLPFEYFKDIDTYYRIRLTSKFVKNFSHIFRPNNSFLESAFSSVELIDLRINDTRDINLSLLDNIVKKGKWFKISLIHLFIMRNLTDEYILSDIKLNSVRQLEENTWTNYVGNNNFKYDKTIAYHLKTTATENQNGKKKFIEDYNALIKFRFEDRQLFKYLIYITLFALVTAIVANALFKGLELLIK